MAWIVKNSGGMTIDRRPEPYLDDQLKATLEAEVLPRYPNKRAATLPVLHAIEAKHNWIPYQAIEEAGAFLGLNPAEVLDTASFYEMFHLQPKGKYLIMVCQSISCELLGNETLMHKLEQKLGIEAGQTTDDGKFTLTHAECLGSCGTAPCALVNEKLHENLTVENLDRIIDSLP
jgi:NADH-quinone oxidoreductase subunit E